MYMVIKGAVDRSSAGKPVFRPNQPMDGFELSTRVPSHVASDNEYVYLNLDTLTDTILNETYEVSTVDEYLDLVVNNIDVITLQASYGRTSINHSELKFPTNKADWKRDRVIPADEWNSTIHPAWHRLAHVVNMFRL